MAAGKTALQRFEEKYIPDPVSACWNWVGAKWRDGYGNFILNGRSTGAHRAAWQLYRGSIPENLLVLHKCDNPACVNPLHLFLGTDADNANDKARKGRSAKMYGRANPSSKLSDGQVAEIAANDTQNACDIAKLYGISPSTVLSIKKGLIWGHLNTKTNPASSARPSIRGSGNPKAKITEDIARKILADTRKTRFVAAEYGVSKLIVTSIRTRKTWKHL